MCQSWSSGTYPMTSRKWVFHGDMENMSTPSDLNIFLSSPKSLVIASGFRRAQPALFPSPKKWLSLPGGQYMSTPARAILFAPILIAIWVAS